MTIYRRPKFLEVLHSLREEMSREADYDMDLFAEFVRSGKPARDAGESTWEIIPTPKTANVKRTVKNFK